MVAERKTIAEIEAHYLPLIAAAREEAEQRRDEAWLDVPYTVCGIELRAMTLRDYLALIAAGNPHVTATRPAAGTVEELKFWTSANFALLWLLSSEYRPVPAARDAFVGRHIEKIPLAGLVEGISEYLRTIFADRPRVVKQENHAVVPVSIAASFAAFWIHDFGEAYGWTVNETLGLALPRIFQLRQLLRHDASLAVGKRPPPAADEADRLAAAAFAEIAALT